MGCGLVSLSSNILPGENLTGLLNRILREMRRRNLDAAQGTVFGDPALAKTLGEPLPFPAAFLARHDTPEGDLRGARITALPSGTFRRVQSGNGTQAGVAWETSDARCILLAALAPGDTSATPGAQSAALWKELKKLLADARFNITDVVRTWFYNDRILDWYDDFNRVRTAFFNENAIFGKLVPASTGIGAANPQGAALMLDAMAVAPKQGATLEIKAVPSPLQCPANDYKSAFSRAVEISGQDGRHLFISGTASIEPEGRTAHTGDLDAQIKLSLRVVGAILESRGMRWEDTARAILYFPSPAWMKRFEPCRASLNLPPIPAIFAHGDICRGDLLFEIELDAFKA
jgi:enamine deaminase RidA (YjgF/YER057c/UK114 family)